MPCKVSICEEADLIVGRFYGRVEEETALQALQEVEALARRRPCSRVCWDGRSITNLAFGPSEVERRLEQLNRVEEELGAGRTAVIAVRGIDRSLARLVAFRAQKGARTWKVFQREQDALLWLFGGDSSHLEAASSALASRPE